MTTSTVQPRKNWLGIHWTVWCVLGFAVALLLIEHYTHVLGILPYLLILACPIMHYFMHGKHGHGGDGQRAGPHDPDRNDKA